MISDKLGLTEDVIKRKWKNLRDAMTKCLKKININTRSGAGAQKTPTCKHFENLLFIKDTISNSVTESNILEQPSFPTSPQLVIKRNPIVSPSPSPPPQSSSSSSNRLTPLTTPLRKKSKLENGKEKMDERRDKIDMMIIEALTPSSKESVELDADLLFCQSLVPTLRKLPSKKNRLSKIDIQKVLLKYEFDDDDL